MPKNQKYGCRKWVESRVIENNTGGMKNEKEKKQTFQELLAEEQEEDLLKENR